MTLATALLLLRSRRLVGRLLRLVRILRRRGRDEELFRTFAALAPTGIFLTDTVGRVMYLNPALERMVGLPADAALGFGWLDALEPERRERALAFLRESLAGRTLSPREFSLTGDDTCWLYLCVAPLYEADGAVKGLVGVCSDVTALKSEQAARMALQQELFRSSQLAAIGQLAAGVAHEVNNPLAIAKGFLELILRKFPRESLEDPRLKEAFAHIGEALERIRRVIEGLMVFSPSEREQIETLDVAQMIHGLHRFFAKMFSNLKIALDVRLPEEPGPFVAADRGRLQQILLNLIGNARDAVLEKGTGAVLLWVRSEGGRVFMGVSDTGVGIPKELRDRIFTPFFSTKGVGKGTGLGLSTSLAAVQRMGGKLTVESEPGAGSTFIVELPQTCAVPVSAVSDFPPVQPTLSRFSGAVLVVDDEVALCEFLRDVLELHGFEVVLAHRADAALVRLREREFRVLLVDVLMPGGSGDELVALASREGLLRGAGVIAMTGGLPGDNTDSQRVFVQTGADAFLQKPFSLKSLIEVVARVVARTGACG